ncbi:hypothetical protein F4678DRAFT_443035 [Xylaria arbuscula]|nr:hypothetical protein F4678DRAFT_443035 [Xylaria arbuscula]
MKSTIAFIPFFALLTAAVDFDWMSLKDANCTGIELVDQFTLGAQCDDPYTWHNEGEGTTRWLSLSLDRCFANNKGNLEYVPHGNFSWECGACDLHKYIYTCQCEVSKGGFPQETSFNLNDANIITLSVTDYNYTMACHGLNDISNP